MNWRRVFHVRLIFGRIIYILSASNFYQQLLWKIVFPVLVLNLFGYVGDFIFAFGKTKSSETDLARFQRTLADGRIGRIVRHCVGFNQLVIWETTDKITGTGNWLLRSAELLTYRMADGSNVWFADSVTGTRPRVKHSLWIRKHPRLRPGTHCKCTSTNMAKKSTKTTREQQYRDILAKDGIRFEDCRVLSFVFEYPIKTELFHYGLMAEKPDYYIFDCWDKNANVVVPKDETNDAHITLIAEQLGGQKTTANLR